MLNSPGQKRGQLVEVSCRTHMQEGKGFWSSADSLGVSRYAITGGGKAHSGTWNGTSKMNNEKKYEVNGCCFYGSD